MLRGRRSSRTTPLPADWSTTRQRILLRDGRACQWPTNGAICGKPARNVDHKKPGHLGGTDNDDNLWSLCDRHERAKSSAEGGRAWQEKRRQRTRRETKHPGLL